MIKNDEIFQESRNRAAMTAIGNFQNTLTPGISEDFIRLVKTDLSTAVVVDSTLILVLGLLRETELIDRKEVEEVIRMLRRPGPMDDPQDLRHVNWLRYGTGLYLQKLLGKDGFNGSQEV